MSRGHGVRLYIKAGTAGSLVVLHSRTDGKIEVLFPARPTDDPHITPGTWELRGKGEGPIWTVAEPDGTGMILAALTPDPVWFDEFSHDVSWNPGALQPSWGAADAEGGMQDIVQRMLGDGGFTYDVLTYTVAPEAIAQAPVVPQGAAAFQSSGQFQNPDDTFPTIDNTPQDATKLCDVSNADVQCSYFNDPLVFGRGSRHGRRGPQPAPAPALPTPANPQGIALMVTPIHSNPAPHSPGPVVQPRRPVPQVPVRTRPSNPAPASWPTAGAVRTLASHPVTGAELGRLAGAAPAARAAMVLRYVHAPMRETAPEASGLAAAAVVAAPRLEGAPSAPTTVAANLPIRANGTMLMSRAVRPGATAGGARNTAARAPAVAAHPAAGAAGTVAPRTGGTVGGWMVIPRRR
ncbi:MAG TPA: hypothetical protein VH113_01605 [Gemmatimonadales bacterium]|nr:hypothetical protein [Gemmatimonadales bacterium]